MSPTPPVPDRDAMLAYTAWVRTASLDQVAAQLVARDAETARLRPRGDEATEAPADPDLPGQQASSPPLVRAPDELLAEAVVEDLDRVTSAMRGLADRVTGLERRLDALDELDRSTAAVRDEYLLDHTYAADRDVAARDVEQVAEAGR